MGAITSDLRNARSDEERMTGQLLGKMKSSVAPSVALGPAASGGWLEMQTPRPILTPYLLSHSRHLNIFGGISRAGGFLLEAPQDKIPFLAFSNLKGHLNSLARDSLLYLQRQQQNSQENLRVLIEGGSSGLTVFQSLVLSFPVLNIYSCSFSRYSVGTYLVPGIVDSGDNLAQSRS